MNKNPDNKVNNVLRAKDIIPSSRPSTASGTPPNPVPKFNLAEEIMAQHRKITAAKRKPPENTNQPRQEKQKPLSANVVKDAAIPQIHEADSAIAEIVARDIRKMCQGYHR